MHLPPDLIELFLALDGAGVRYLLVGGHAVAVHGRPRSTKDVDLWLDPSAANIAKACVALAAFGAPAGIVDSLRDAKRDDIVWLGRSPTRIDLLQSLPGVSFDESWARRVTVEFGGVKVPVIGKTDLIRNKQTVGRPQDRRDVRSLGRENVASSQSTHRAKRRRKK
jgi:predicted nucleotidyltransferase